MGRNPVVGRQGPKHHAETMLRTLRSIGLRNHQSSTEVDNTATMRGMLYKVRHLIQVTPVGEN
jgi:ribosomal protein L30/L7E